MVLCLSLTNSSISCARCSRDHFIIRILNNETRMSVNVLGKLNDGGHPANDASSYIIWLDNELNFSRPDLSFITFFLIILTWWQTKCAIIWELATRTLQISAYHNIAQILCLLKNLRSIREVFVKLVLPLITSGPTFCLLLGVISDYAQPIRGQVTEVTCPVISRAQLELAPSKRQKTGPEVMPVLSIV